MKVGAPSFAFFAKGGHDAARSAAFDLLVCHAADSILPTLAKDTRTGHRSRGGIGNSKARPPAGFLIGVRIARGVSREIFREIWIQEGPGHDPD